MKVNRRQLLWSGLGVAIATALGRDQMQRQARQAEQTRLEALAKEQFAPEKLLEQAYQSDLAAVQELVAVQRSIALQPPPLPYSRDWSKLLIRANKLATQQYLTGKYQTDYDGDIAALPLYTEGFQDYQQVTSFRAAEQVQERFTVEIPISNLATHQEHLGQQLDQTRAQFENQVQQAIQLIQPISVYYGYLLTSNRAHLLVFRGTQRGDEYFQDILALQVDYAHPTSQAVLGKVHSGFYNFYDQNFTRPVIEAVQTLDPAKPLIITGHSLGAALANLAALDIALQLPALQPTLQLFTYASPRVGNPALVNIHSQQVPNHYRVVNLADMVPMMPLSKLFGDFVHAGQQWSFLSQQGDILPNHIIETYRYALDQELETTADRGFSNLQLPSQKP